MEPNLKDGLPSTVSSPLSYANIAKKETFPTKDQAIILDAIDELSIRDYAITIAEFTGPAAVRYISKISNNRICIYLDSKNSVDKLLASHKNIEIKNKKLTIRPLIVPSKRIIISNVYPDIPHYVIEEVFKNNNIRLCSRVTNLKAGIFELTHTLSFRRQLYVNPDDVVHIPESFVVSYNDTQYHLFASSDKIKCFICKNDGHIAKNCPNVPEKNISSQQSDIYAIDTDSQPSVSKSSHLSDIDDNDNDNDNNSNSQPPVGPSHVKKIQTSNCEHIDLPLKQNEPISQDTILTPDPPLEIKPQKTSHNTIVPNDPMDIDPNKSNKRPLSISSNQSSTIHNTRINTMNLASKPKKKPITSSKKAKTEPKLSTATANLIKNIDVLLQPAKTSLEENLHILNYSQFKNLLSDTLSKKDTLEAIKVYTDNFPALINMLEEVYPLITDRSLKNRLHRLTKKLNHIISATTSDSESDKEQSYSTD